MAAHLVPSGRDLVSLGSTERGGLDLGKLRADLAALWRDEGRGVVKACHATLILSVSRSEDAETLLDDLVRDRPSRVLLLEPDAALASGEIHAWATGSCFRGLQEGSLICSEAVHLEVGAATDARVTSVVRSLAVGGMPVEVLVLSGSPRGLAWIEALGSEVDRVLFHGGVLPIPESAALWERSLRSDELPRYADVTWAALEGWRWVVASSFDGERSRRLSEIRRVRLEVGDPLLRASEAILFGGWLASRLGWNHPRREGELRWLLRTSDGHEVKLEVGPTPEGDRAAGLSTLSLYGAAKDHLGIWRWSFPDRIWKVEPGGGGPARIVRAVPETASTPWLRALRRPRASAAAREALTLAHRLASG